MYGGGSVTMGIGAWHKTAWAAATGEFLEWAAATVTQDSSFSRLPQSRHTIAHLGLAAMFAVKKVLILLESDRATDDDLDSEAELHGGASERLRLV